jgi:small subunit ribosomal protein S21
MHSFAAQEKGGVQLMIIVPIKEGENIERALKKFKRKFEKTGTIRELRSRKTFVKRSVKRREEVKKAIYVQALHLNEE